MREKREVYSANGGFWSATARHMSPTDVFTDESEDWVMVPASRKVRKRYGTDRSVANALTTPVSAVSGLSANTALRGRNRVAELRNRNLGYISEIISSGANPVPMMMLTDEDPARLYGSIYHGEATYGPIVGITVAGGVATGGAPSVSTYNALSELWPYIGGGRFVGNPDRWAFGSGGRNFVETDRWLALSKLYGVPGRWNKEWWGLGTLIERVMPNGKIPPAWEVTVTNSAGASGSWPANSKFYYTVIYEDDDGTFGPMTQVRPPAAGTIHGANGYCYYSFAAQSDYIDVSNIPIGPAGTRRRHLCRSLVVTAGVPDPATIGICATIDDNTSTTYRDYYGMDEAVEPFPEGIRQDYIWAPQHRYQWAFDQRFACGYTRPNLGAILIFNYHTDGAGSYVNTSIGGAMFVAGAAANDVASGSSDYGFYVKKSGTDLILYLWNGSFANPSTGHWSETLALTGLTLQDVVDHINARTGWGTTAAPWTATKLNGTVPGWPSGSLRFYAQLAPGADATASATELADTTTYTDWGDSYNTGATDFKNMRTYGPMLSAILTMNSTWSARYRTERTTVYFTGGGPGHAPYGISSYYVENFRSLPSDYGYLVGGAPLLDGCLVLCTLGVGLMRNIRDGKTGLDEDYRLEPIAGIGGCIAPESIVHLNGAVGYLSREGYVITDGRTFRVISGAVYDPGSRLGVWSYEIAACETACQQDDDDATFSASIVGSRLIVSYRHNTLTPTRRLMIYDFSASGANSGIEQFLDPNGNPFGWSCPLSFSYSIPGSYRTASNLVHAAIQFTSGTAMGIWTFEDPAQLTDFGGASIDAVGFLKTDNLGTDLKKSLKELRVRYRKEASGMFVAYTRHLAAHATPALFNNIQLPATTAGDPYSRKRIEARVTERSPSDIYEIKISDNGTTTTTDFFEIEALFDVLDSLY